MGFSEFDDQNTKGENFNLVSPSTPSDQAEVNDKQLNIRDPYNTYQQNQSTVGTTAVRLDTSPLSERKAVVLIANKDVYIGHTNGVTTSSGYSLLLRKGQSIWVSWGPSLQIWAISGNAGVGSDDLIATEYARGA